MKNMSTRVILDRKSQCGWQIAVKRPKNLALGVKIAKFNFSLKKEVNRKKNIYIKMTTMEWY